METLKSTIKILAFALASVFYSCSEPDVAPVVPEEEPVAEEKPSGSSKTEAKFSVKGDDFEMVVNDMISKGYIPSYIDGSIHQTETGIETLFNIIFKEDKNTSEYEYFYGLNEGGLEATIDVIGDTHNLIFLESYPQGGEILFAAIFKTGEPTQFHTELKIPYNQWQGTFDQMTDLGYRMACRSTVRDNGGWYVSALFDKTSVGSWIAAASLTPASMVEKIEEQYEKGRSVCHFDVLQETSSKYTFGAIFDSTTDTPIMKKMDMTSAQLVKALEDATNSGFALQTLSAYDYTMTNGDDFFLDIRFVATWKSLRGM